MTISCQQFLVWMSDYLDGELDPTLTEAMLAHGRQCGPCQVVLDTTGKMLRIVGDDRTFPMPEGASQRLRQALEQGLGEPLIPHALRPPTAPPPPRQKPPFWGFRKPASAWAAALVLLLLAVGVVRWRASATTTSGWLIDRHCFAAFQNHVADHTRDCLLRCAASVYGLVDAQGHFRPFDAKGNRSALAAVRASTKRNHLWVTVRAKRSDAPMLEVQELQLTDPTDAASPFPVTSR